MLARTTLHHLHRVARTLAVTVGGLTVGQLAFAQPIATFSVEEMAPALTLSVEGEPTMPLETLRAELEQATGKPVIFAEGNAKRQGSAGSLVVTFESDAAGTPKVNIVYHPPLAELTRSDTLPAGELEMAHHIGLLAQGIIQRDAGITLLAPHPSPTIADTSLGSCAQSAELARPVVVEHQTQDAPVDKPSKPVADDVEPPRWRAALGLRWGPLGFGITTSPLASGTEGASRMAVPLDGAAWMVGGTLHVDAPSSSRFTLGLEVFLDQFSIDGRSDDGIGRSVTGTYVGLAAAPVVRLFSLPGLGELRFGIGVGATYAPALNISSDNSDTTFVDEGLGYRLGGALSGTGWVSPALGVSVALGFDHTFVTGSGVAFLSSNPETGFAGAVDGTTDIWLNQPYLRVSADYRF